LASNLKGKKGNYENGNHVSQPLWAGTRFEEWVRFLYSLAQCLKTTILVSGELEQRKTKHANEIMNLAKQKLETPTLAVIASQIPLQEDVWTILGSVNCFS
jgi:hypothetical protein